MSNLRLLLAALTPMVLAMPAWASGPAADPKQPAVKQLDRTALAAEVRDEFLRSWKAYKEYAWGHDELKPLTKAPRDWYGESLLMTPVDALDTMLLMGLTEEADEAKQLILDKLSFDRDLPVKNFEITIRLLGGLLSSYQITGDERLLRLADDLGGRLLPAFESPTGMPYMFVNLKTGKPSGARSNPAEIGTLVLEFGTLSRLTGKQVYYDKAKNALVQLYRRRSKMGLVGEEIDVETGHWVSPQSHVGGGIDSYYEYLLKCSRLFDDKECGTMWRESLSALNKHLADEAPSGFWYAQVDMNTGKRTASEFGALHAFLPAVLALGGDLKHARRLQSSCDKMWRMHGIEPDLFDYRSMRVVAPAYPLRPEIIESATILHRLTRDPIYLAMGRAYFEAIKQRCRTDAGTTVLKDVTTGEQGDLMPSYYLAETLKYLYLLFSPDSKLDLDKVVFNTEAHPLRKAAPRPDGAR
ncbi:MAG TPA: glycoside hydrolase family 47 protein [Candidatus Polarisedimenticolia bacterium]|nr:glycoside hydrolase family 47 protein [Candidatus Polarisedimenticolia bacterium]